MKKSILFSALALTLVGILAITLANSKFFNASIDDLNFCETPDTDYYCSDSFAFCIDFELSNGLLSRLTNPRIVWTSNNSSQFFHPANLQETQFVIPPYIQILRQDPYNVDITATVFADYASLLSFGEPVVTEISKRIEHTLTIHPLERAQFLPSNSLGVTPGGIVPLTISFPGYLVGDSVNITKSPGSFSIIHSTGFTQGPAITGHNIVVPINRTHDITIDIPQYFAGSNPILIGVESPCILLERAQITIVDF